MAKGTSFDLKVRVFKKEKTWVETKIISIKMGLTIPILDIKSFKMVWGLQFYKALKISTTRKPHNGERGSNEEFFMN